MLFFHPGFDHESITSGRKAVDVFHASDKIETTLTPIDPSGAYSKKLT
jgi:hypothetical protein